MARDGGRTGALSPADVAGALHDVSNALTVILGWVGEARAPGASVESVAHALLIVEQQAQIARDLARRAIGASPEDDLIDDVLDPLLAGAVEALGLEAARGGVRLRRRGRGGTVRVVEASDLLQVVTNVVLNALAHAPRGSEITLETAAGTGTITVDVQDAGPGVPPERHASIFDGSSTRAGGVGVGLRHSRDAARNAGGDLELVAVPSGARFRITWPRAIARSLPPPSMPSTQVLAGTRVLVVEDDEQVTLLLETALGARGAVVTIAHDAAELAKAVATDRHDAALIDLSPIAADVEGAIGALRKTSPDAAIVFISGSAVGLPDALVGESVSWVRKPFEVSELVTALLAAKNKARSP